MPRAGAVIAVIAFVGVAGAAAYWGPGLVDTYGDRVSTERCTVTDASGSYSLTAEQADNAAIIAGVGRSYGYDAHGITVAIATAIQESSLRNIDYGDRDSVGLFQQRPSQGWGTVEQIADPRYAASKFYEALAKVDGWADMPLTQAAQAVQRSGFPDAYAPHEPQSAAWASAFTGGPASVSCDIDGPGKTTAEAFVERAGLDLGASYTVEVLGYEGNTTVLGIRPLAADEVSVKIAQAWAIATASTSGSQWVDAAGQTWSPDGSVAATDTSLPGGSYPGVRVAIATS